MFPDYWEGARWGDFFTKTSICCLFVIVVIGCLWVFLSTGLARYSSITDTETLTYNNTHNTYTYRVGQNIIEIIQTNRYNSDRDNTYNTDDKNNAHDMIQIIKIGQIIRIDTDNKDRYVLLIFVSLVVAYKVVTYTNSKSSDHLELGSNTLTL